MTDLTDEYLDALVAKLTDIGKFAIGGGTASEAARAITALRQREAEAVAGAIEAAAHLVSATAYTSNGDKRSLEPVAKGFEGQDMHHATIATAIRALHTDATRAALDRAKAEGMREANTAHAKTILADLCEWLAQDEDNGTLLLLSLSEETLTNLRAILAAADKPEEKS